ncbi:MAG: hypothetical protein AB4290_31185, partial [Spirulina sp.]
MSTIVPLPPAEITHEIDTSALFETDPQRRNRVEGVQGVGIALAIAGLWGFVLILGLSLDLAKVPPILLGLGMLGQTFLYTGLFITAHDAMHGLV